MTIRFLDRLADSKIDALHDGVSVQTQPCFASRRASFSPKARSQTDTERA
jgi:hypothetical protein